MALPIMKTDDDSIQRLQTAWASELNPVIANSILKGLQITTTLATGNNVVNHKLGRKLQGWFIVRMRNAYAAIYDTQDTNRTPTLTLTLNSTAPCVVDLWVY